MGVPCKDETRVIVSGKIMRSKQKGQIRTFDENIIFSIVLTILRDSFPSFHTWSEGANLPFRQRRCSKTGDR